MDLRELAPLVEDVATEHSKIPDGESGKGFRWLHNFRNHGMAEEWLRSLK